MTMVDIGHNMYPVAKYLPQNLNNAYGNNAATFDSSTDKLAFLFIAHTSFTLTDISFLTGTVTTGGTVEVRVETVNNGRPSGTLWNSPTNTTNGTVAIANTDDNTWKSVTLTASASISVGDKVAIVVVHSSGTHNGSYWTGLANAKVSPVFPCWLHDTGAGSWTHISSSPYLILENSGTPIYIPGALPFSSVSNTGFDSADSPDEYALQFVPPAKMRCIGAAVSLGNISAGADFTVSLWANDGTTDADGTVLGSAVIDGDLAPSTSTEGFWEVFWASPVTLTAGATYHIGVRADTATANGVGVLVFNLAGTGIPSGYISASPFGGNCYLKTRVWTAGDPGDWTSDTTKIPNFRAIIDQVDDGTGAGSSTPSGAGHVFGG